MSILAFIYVECRECGHYSGQGCADCASQHAAFHTAQTGHTRIVIRGLDTAREDEQSDRERVARFIEQGQAEWRDSRPHWLHGERRRARRDSA